MTIPPLSLGIIKGAEWLKARHAEMFTYGQAHGHMNKNAEHTSVHALAGRLQAGPSGNLELTVPSSLIKGVFDALDEPGAEFVVRNNRTECAIKVMTKEEVDKLGGVSHISERGHSYHYTLGPIVELPATGDYDKLWAISIKSNDLEDIRKSYGLETSPQLGFYIPVGCKKKRVTEDNAVSKLASVHEYAANDPNMRILSQGPVTDRDFLYHASGKKFDSLDPSYNSKKSFGHEYNAPVVFAGDSPSSAFAANPTAEYQAVKDKIRNSVYHRLIDEQTGRKALLGHTPGGYLYKLPASAFTKIDREDNELGKWNKSTEYVSHMPVKPISVTPMQSTDVDAIPEYEYLGEDFVGEMPAQHYLNHAKDPKVIAAVKAWLGNKQEKLAGDTEPKKELVRIKLDDNDGKSLTHHYLTAKKWDYPAGKVEPNEDRDDAAVRELRERTGHHIDKSKLKYNGHSDGFHQYSGALSDVSKIDPAHYETGEPRQLSWKKEAGVYTASGEKVQGVGLRKMYHSLLEEQGLPGLGVNNEDTGDVELSFDGDEAKRQEVFDQLSSRVQAKTGHPVTFAPVDIPQSSVPVKLTNKDTERLNAIHHLAYRMSNMYDPADPLLDSNDSFKQKLADRFRLQVSPRGIKGTVPSRAAEQLLGTRPMYEGMMPARRTRSEEEALSDMAEEQKRRLLKALKGGRGFLAPNESGVSKLASLLKKAEGEATPPPIEPISLPSHSPPSGMPAPSIPQGTDFNAMYKTWAKGQAGSGMPARGEGADYARRPVAMRFGSEALGDPQMPVNTSPSGAKQLGTVNFGNRYHTDTDYSRPDHIPAKKISPGVDSGPGVFRVSAHGAGERGNYELSNPGNQPIGIGDGSYTSNMPSSMYNQNPTTVISQACNAGGGCTPATYGNMFKSLNPMLPYNTKPNLNKVVMTPPGFYASGTHPQHRLSFLGESGSAGQPSQYDADDAPYKGNISAYHEYRLAKGGNPSNEAHWTDTGVYNDARQEGLPLVGLGGEALEMARHFNLSPELGGGNFNSYLDKTRRITSNPDASYQEKVRSSWARPIGSAAELARSSAEIVGSADWNKHLDGMNKRVQSKMNKTPSLSTTN